MALLAYTPAVHHGRHGGGVRRSGERRAAALHKVASRLLLLLLVVVVRLHPSPCVDHTPERRQDPRSRVVCLSVYTGETPRAPEVANPNTSRFGV